MMIHTVMLILSVSARQETTEEQYMADMARESFKAPGERRSLDGYTNVPVSLLEGRFSSLIPANAFALWKNDEHKEVILALRGTPITQPAHGGDDICYDKAIAENRFTKTDRAHQALNTLRAVQSQFAGYSITLTGHSLGGTTALLLLAQDAKNDVITHEENQRPVISSVFVYNAYKGNSIFFPFSDDSEAHREAFFKIAFSDPRLHGLFIDQDPLSSVTRKMAEAMLPEDRLFIGYLTGWFISERAHNIDGGVSYKLTSPGYSF